MNQKMSRSNESGERKGLVGSRFGDSALGGKDTLRAFGEKRTQGRFTR